MTNFEPIEHVSLSTIENIIKTINNDKYGAFLKINGTNIYIDINTTAHIKKDAVGGSWLVIIGNSSTEKESILITIPIHSIKEIRILMSKPLNL